MIVANEWVDKLVPANDQETHILGYVPEEDLSAKYVSPLTASSNTGFSCGLCVFVALDWARRSS